MPWTAESYRRRHNKKLSSAEAGAAAKQATAMINSGVPEGVAIATANKHANTMRERRKARYANPRKRMAAGGS